MTTTEPVVDTIPDHSDPNRRATRAEILAARAYVAEQTADWDTTTANAEAAKATEYERALTILIYGRKTIDEETTALYRAELARYHALHDRLAELEFGVTVFDASEITEPLRKPEDPLPVAFDAVPLGDLKEALAEFNGATLRREPAAEVS
jgi:hypothetical protein